MSGLSVLDFLVPKDGGSRRIARGLAYGPNPRHRLDLYAPKAAAGPLPLMMFFYGGSWNSGSRGDYAFAGRAFAALGFLVAIADYRVVPEVRFPAFLEDGGLAATWLLAHAAEHGGDPSRVFLAGHSAGAYNAVMLGLQPGRFGAPGLGRVMAGVVGLSGPYDFYPFDVSASIEAFGEALEPLLTQPVNLVTSAAPPMFLAHGERDKSVRPRNTAALASKLRKVGVPVEEKHYALDHAGTALALMRPFRERTALFADMSGFLAAHANPQAALAMSFGGR